MLKNKITVNFARLAILTYNNNTDWLEETNDLLSFMFPSYILNQIQFVLLINF